MAVPSVPHAVSALRQVSRLMPELPPKPKGYDDVCRKCGAREGDPHDEDCPEHVDPREEAKISALEHRNDLEAAYRNRW